MWEFEHSVQAPAFRERIWALWTDVSGWPSWNPGVGHAELDGPLTEGATGTVRAVGGPTSTLKVVTIEPQRLFVTETSERLMRLRFEQELADVEGGALRITHRVRMTGPATPLMRHTVGARLQRSMPAALAALVELVTTVPPPENG
jgi:Polyketide cyclase / dehydrase and lipid transport